MLLAPTPSPTASPRVPTDCMPMFDPTCAQAEPTTDITAKVGEAVGGFVTGGINGIIEELAKPIIDDAVRFLIAGWTYIPSGLPCGGGGGAVCLGSPVAALQQWMSPIAMTVAVLSMIAAGAKVALSGKANPLMDMGTALLGVLVVSALSVVLPDLLLQAGDAWSAWVLDQSTGGQFEDRIMDLVRMSRVAPGARLILAIAALLVAITQVILMIFRYAALIVLAGMLPLAASGLLSPMTRPWFPKVSGWMLALIFYKPCAAAVYAAAFAMIGKSAGVLGLLTGMAMIVLSIFALPVLLKLFTWTTGSLAESSGGGFLGAVVGGAVAVGSFRGRGRSASDQAGSLSQSLGPAGPGGGAGPAGASAGGGRGPTGAGGPGGGNGRPGGPGGGPSASPTGSSHSGAVGGGASGGSGGAKVVQGTVLSSSTPGRAASGGTGAAGGGAAGGAGGATGSAGGTAAAGGAAKAGAAGGPVGAGAAVVVTTVASAAKGAVNTSASAMAAPREER